MTITSEGPLVPTPSAIVSLNWSCLITIFAVFIWLWLPQRGQQLIGGCGWWQRSCNASPSTGTGDGWMSDDAWSLSFSCITTILSFARYFVFSDSIETSYYQWFCFAWPTIDCKEKKLTQMHKSALCCCRTHRNANIASLLNTVKTIRFIEYAIKEKTLLWQQSHTCLSHKSVKITH